MNYKEVLITPEMAKEFLANNPINRNIRNKRLAKYCDAIKKGEWTLSPSPISFSKDGRLLDGQHRLTAIVLTGIPVKMVVAYGVSDDAVFDKGAERTTGDSLYMRGLIDKKVSSHGYIAIVKAYFTLLLNKDPSDEEIGKFINEYEEEILDTYKMSSVKQNGSDNKVCRKAAVQAGILGAVLCGVDYNTIERLCRIANSGFPDSKADYAALVLRKKVAFLKTTTERKILALYTQTALRDFIKGLPRTREYKTVKAYYVKEVYK